jgi:hypothetical protein
MKKFLSVALLLALGSVPAISEKISQTLHVPEDVYVGTVKLNQGDYKMVAEGTGSVLVVTITREGKQMVKANARVIEAKHDNVAVTVSEQTGKPILQTIELKNMTLVMGMQIQ